PGAGNTSRSSTISCTSSNRPTIATWRCSGCGRPIGRWIITFSDGSIAYRISPIAEALIGFGDTRSAISQPMPNPISGHGLVLPADPADETHALARAYSHYLAGSSGLFLPIEP